MKVRPTRLEWEVVDESNAGATTRLPRCDDGGQAASKRSHRRLVVFAGIILLLASFIGLDHLVNRAEQNMAQTEREIAMAVEADFWSQDPAAPKLQVQAIDLHNDLAIVKMSVDDGVVPAGRAMLGATAYYRYSAEGWRRVEPYEADRGAYRYQETDHFLFQYYQVDQSVVEAVVPAVETFNVDLHRDIGLDLPPAHEKVTVRIAIVAAKPSNESFELVRYARWDSDGIVVLSPHFARGSTTLATAATLKQAINATVAYRTILLAVEEYQPQVVWQPLVDGLQLWAYAAHREFDADLTNQMNNLLRQQLANKTPLRLPALSALPLPLHDPEETLDSEWQQSVVPKTVIDCIVATYGRGSLARLLNGMHQYDSWQSLIPAVFGDSMEEFESGWQAYLAARYNLSP